MTKLKCWKKTREGYKHKKKNEEIFISGITKLGYDVYVKDKFGSSSINRNIIKKKPQALKFAKSYMKKHDKC